LVSDVQKRLGVEIDGKFDGLTEAAVRAFQRGASLVPDGIVGPKTWSALDEFMAIAPQDA
jgi:peptidoglycan hydrolase-like protein with peptidoglycan-binding domain